MSDPANSQARRRFLKIAVVGAAIAPVAASLLPRAARAADPHVDPNDETARALGMSITAYYAMADGKVLDDAVLREIAAGHGRSVAQIVLRWIVQQDMVTLSKTVSEARAAENAEIFDLELTGEEMAAIHALARADGRIVSPPGLAPIWDEAA